MRFERSDEAILLSYGRDWDWDSADLGQTQAGSTNTLDFTSCALLSCWRLQRVQNPSGVYDLAKSNPNTVSFNYGTVIDLRNKTGTRGVFP
ncbi:hypothetical protein PSA01_59010 [Pseudonocardia saturnea]|uniref:Uncharacterized protein n=2 Tax=Pseudonocardia TaxID=1847 RepID=A0A1Y2MPF5_PSEAH|nr:hypothetical protein BG845_05142 [Pseudonocardia autotrophica]BBG00861.1 hypothetical protein Pdca_20700 [Pseudonocardia autotrophica]GEC28872.1 hypothetical protein PSA01_59010 [Pseudonocardia saturnea]